MKLIKRLFSYVELVAGMGLASALLKFATNNNTPEEDKAYLRFSGKWGSIIQFAVSGIVCVVISLVELPFEQAKIYIYSLAIFPCLNYFLSVLQTYIRAHEEYKKYAIIGFVQALLVCGLGSLFAFYKGAQGLVVARYIAILFVIIYGIRIIKDSVKDVSVIRLSKKSRHEFIGMGVSLVFADFFSAVMPINETFLVNNLIGNEVITANFKVAGLLPSQLLLVTGSIVVYFFPKVAKIKDGQKTLSYVLKITLLNFVLQTIITFVGIVFTPFIIDLLYGSKYHDAIEMSYLLWIMRYINVVFRMIPMNFLPAIGETKFNAMCCAISCVVHIVIDYLCIVNYGIDGLAIATILVYLLSGGAFWSYFIYVCKKKA